MKTRGLVIGKFVPPHLGHSALISFAAARCDELYVIICDNPRYAIAGPLRRQWLEEMHPGVRFVLIEEQHADDDSEGWAIRTRAVLGFVPDMVFTSEAYGEPYCRFLGSSHVPFDPDRRQVPVSGTAVRRDPFGNWQHLHPVVRAHYVKRVALVGAESCGKTTLATALARRFKTWWVPEYGRFYWDAKQFAGEDPIWTTPEFEHIARLHNLLEDSYARRANKILFCDTNAFMTSVWHRRYLNHYAPAVDREALSRRYDLVIFCPADIPFVQDGTRDGELIRPEMSRWTEDKLRAWGTDYHVVQGSPEMRLAAVSKLAEALLRPAEE